MAVSLLTQIRKRLNFCKIPITLTTPKPSGGIRSHPETDHERAWRASPKPTSGAESSSDYTSFRPRSACSATDIDVATRQVVAERMPEIIAIQEHQRKQTQTFLRSDRFLSRLAMRILLSW